MARVTRLVSGDLGPASHHNSIYICWADRGTGVSCEPARARQDSREDTAAWAAQLLQGACSTTGLTTPGGEERGEGVSGVSVLYLDHSNLLRGAGSRRGPGSLTSALTSSVSQ